MRSFIMAFVAFVSLVFATAVSAEETAPSANTPKLANGHGNNCASDYYPADAVRLGEEGPTTVAVHIDATGKPTGVDITASSGFADLDQASRDCVMKNWHFSPATENGKPVASVKQYRIIWKLNDSYSLPEPVKNPVDVCGPAFADAQKSWSTYKSTTFKFRLSSSGAVEMPFVAVSSGSAAFDAKAFQCLTSIVYSPPMVNGVAFDASWGAAVRWSPHTGLAYTNAQGVGPACSDDDFPPNLWKGDPPRQTTISFHIRTGGVVAEAAIEQSSGNAQLDQAALTCVEQWSSGYKNVSQKDADIGELVRFTWKSGYVFTTSDVAY